MKKIILLIVAILLVGCDDSNNTQNQLPDNENVISNEQVDQVDESEPEIAEEPIMIGFDDLVDGRLIEDGNYPLGKTIIRYPSSDELMITADLYLIDQTSPFVILFHQAAYSRGEYLETAVKLNELGYNAMAVDQRSGDKSNDVINLTAIRAREAGLGITYKDAIVDVETSIEYISENFETDLYILGSSYSSVIVLSVGQKYEDILSGILSFSPGEYFLIDDKKIIEHVKKLTVPVFISCGSHESYEADLLFKGVGSEVKEIFVPDRLVKHASSILWSENENSDTVWEALQSFLTLTQVIE